MRIGRKLRGSGRGGACVGGDIYMSVQKNSEKGSMSLSVRVRENTLDVLRWRINDRLLIDVEWKDTVLFLILTRATDADDDSLKLSAGGGAANGGASMRVTATEEEIAHIFPAGRNPVVGTLFGGDTKRAVFQMKSV